MFEGRIRDSETTRIEHATPEQMKAHAAACERAARMAAAGKPDPGSMSPAEWQRRREHEAAARIAAAEDALREQREALAEARARLLDDAIRADAASRAAEHLFNGLKDGRGVIKVDTILRVVANQYNVSKTGLLSARRTADVMLPRQICYYFCCKLTRRSLPEIGRRLGGRDHTTVLSGNRKMKARIAADPDFAAEIAAIEAMLMSSGDAG